MGFKSGGEEVSLKELLEVIRPKEFQIDEKGTAPEGEHLRRWALIGAIVAAVIGAGVAWMIWRNAVGQPREQAAGWREFRIQNSEFRIRDTEHWQQAASGTRGGWCGKPHSTMRTINTGEENS
jgi:hypothetical protein